jgi:hypothetical protein
MNPYVRGSRQHRLQRLCRFGLGDQSPRRNTGANRRREILRPSKGILHAVSTSRRLFLSQLGSASSGWSCVVSETGGVQAGGGGDGEASVDWMRRAGQSWGNRGVWEYPITVALSLRGRDSGGQRGGPGVWEADALPALPLRPPCAANPLDLRLNPAILTSHPSETTDTMHHRLHPRPFRRINAPFVPFPVLSGPFSRRFADSRRPRPDSGTPPKTIDINRSINGPFPSTPLALY